MFSQKVKHFMEQYFKRSLSPLPSVNPVNYLSICELFFFLYRKYIMALKHNTHIGTGLSYTHKPTGTPAPPPPKIS